MSDDFHLKIFISMVGAISAAIAGIGLVWVVIRARNEAASERNPANAASPNWRHDRHQNERR